MLFGSDAEFIIKNAEWECSALVNDTAMLAHYCRSCKTVCDFVFACASIAVAACVRI